MSDFSIGAIGGHKKSLEDGIGTGGGYVAYQTPQYNFDFTANPTDAQKKRLDESVASTNIFGQAGLS